MTLTLTLGLRGSALRTDGAYYRKSKNIIVNDAQAVDTFCRPQLSPKCVVPVYIYTSSSFSVNTHTAKHSLMTLKWEFRDT